WRGIYSLIAYEWALGLRALGFVRLELNRQASFSKTEDQKTKTSLADPKSEDAAAEGLLPIVTASF
ncbi:MAG TPA: hypothetical protein VL325_07305, partial [Pyrinomonadaceae bacterium]|nr:hypothetical protein [Pyrinomonadaceae bacterium]